MATRLRAFFLLAILSGCRIARAPLPGPFTRADIAEIADPAHGAQSRARAVFSWFQSGSPALGAPAWLARERAELARVADESPEDGARTQAQLWQEPALALDEFFSITRETFPPAYGGFLLKPLALGREYRAVADRLQEETARLRSLHLERALGGRGAKAIAALEKASGDADALAGSLAAGDDSRYKDSVLSVAYDARLYYRALRAPSR